MLICLFFSMLLLVIIDFVCKDPFFEPEGQYSVVVSFDKVLPLSVC